MTDAERFIAKFEEFGHNPSPESYQDLFDLEGTVLHPGMKEPLQRNQVFAYMTQILSVFQNFGFEVITWGANQNTVFVEAINSAIIGGEKISWGTTYCITLKGDLVLRGRAYADRIPILAKLTPNTTLREAAEMGALAPGLTPK